MDESQLRAIIAATVNAAVEQTQRSFQSVIGELEGRLSCLETPSKVLEYKAVQINSQIKCEESLDLIKSLPEFHGDQLKYVSWRQAVFAAHKMFEGYEGSSKYYQAVAIIRNKIVGSADSVLSSFNTVLNFKAIISRLDFTYSDKRPIYLIEQEMSTLKQGKMSIFEFYDTVEQKLTLLINKTIMSHEGKSELIASLNQKYRQDALRTFISGLRKPMCDVLFASRPADMPTALALAEELEANQMRYTFASSFANYSERSNKLPMQSSQRYNSFNSPYYTREQINQPKVHPMEIDPSTSNYKSQKLNPTQNLNTSFETPDHNNFHNTYTNNRPLLKRSGPSDKYLRNVPFIGNNQSIRQQPQQKIQRFNHLTQDQPIQQETVNYGQYYDNANYCNRYDESSLHESERNEVENPEIIDEINFLGISPSYRT